MAFEAILSQQRTAPSGWRRITLTFSVLLHAVALAVGVAHSIWQVEEMPMPAVEVSLAMAAPPPPPPPPPPKRSSAKRTKPVDTKPKVITAPKETPQEEPEAAEEESAEDEEGEDGGEEGGVIGGVVGGVVGGVAPPPPKSTGPKLLSQGTGHKLLAINPGVRPYKVNVPQELMDRGDVYQSKVFICVSPEGKVASVKIVKASTPAIDLQIPTVLARWKYKPYVVDGRAIPFCYPLLYTVR
jgi:protein TonB